MDFPWDAYAARVGLDAPPRTDEDGLFALHRAQFHAIPFENLDIQLGRPIDLSPTGLVEKLVHQPRGGYCFELNGLLLLALAHLGFRARPVLARVHLQAPPSARTHPLDAVSLGSRTWLADAGFGAGGPREPFPLEDGWEIRGPNFGFRLRREEPWGWMLSTLEGDEWKRSYSFDLGHVTVADIELGNFYTSHSPRSHFTRMRVASLPNATGRVSLRNQELTRLVNGETTRERIPEGEATIGILEREFGIRLGVAFDAFQAVSEEPA